MTQTKQQAKNAELFAKWLEENKPHIAMKDKTEYRNKTTAITFICAEHGEYIAQPYTVKRAKLGCKFCSDKSHQLPFEDFVKSALSIHGDKYEYDENSWNGVRNKTKILCKDCNDYFEQRGDQHLAGSGCRACNAGGGGADNEKNFARNPDLAHETCKLYYSKINGLYTIGITKKTLAQRYRGKQFEILFVRETTRLFAWRAEQMVLFEFEEYKQRGEISGGGSTECFATDISTLENFHEIFNHDFLEPIQ